MENGTVQEKLLIENGTAKENGDPPMAKEKGDPPITKKNGDPYMVNEKHPSLHKPVDRYKLVYMIFVLHGLGTLIPWNVFINAREYFVDYKLNTTISYNSDYRLTFMGYIGFFAQVPNLLMCIVNTFYQGKGAAKEQTRFIGVMVIEIFVLIFTIILAAVDSYDWPRIFFSLTIISVVLINLSTGVYQTLVYGMAANLPMKYSNAVVLGTNLCGTVISLCNIVTKVLAQSVTRSTYSIKMGAVCYFGFSIVILIGCCVTYAMLRRMSFFLHYRDVGLGEDEMEVTPLGSKAPEELEKLTSTGEGKMDFEEKEEGDSTCHVLRNCFGLCCFMPLNEGKRHCRAYWLKFWIAFKSCWVHCLSVFSVFFCTLTAFPAIHSGIKAYDSNYFIPDKWFMDITCFLCFNFFALVGNFCCNWIRIPGPRYLWLPVWIRTLIFVPFFVLSNYDYNNRIIPVLITNDHVYVLGVVIFSFTSGYFSSLCMMYAPKAAPKEYAGYASMIAAFCLVSGITVGVNFSLVLMKVLSGKFGGLPYYGDLVNATVPGT